MDKQMIIKTKTDKYSWSKLFLLLILLKVVLDYACKNVYFLYSLSFEEAADSKRLLYSWVSYIINSFMISVFLLKRRDLISMAYCFLFVLNGVGFYTIFPLKSEMTYEGFITVSIFWLFFTIIVILSPRTKEIANDFKMVDTRIFPLEYLIFVVSAAMTIIYSGVYGDFRIFISFDDVYTYRFEFLERSLPAFVSYTMRWLSGTILPYFFTRFLMCRKKMLAFASLFLGLLMYGIDGLKTTLLLYIIALYFYFRISAYNRKNRPLYQIVYEFIFALCIAIFACVVVFLLTEELFYNTELYRILIIPSNIADNYYNFIKPREALLLRQSVLRAFFPSPYETSISYLVSAQTNKGHQAIANTGLYGDAYANFKMFGVFLYPILYSSVLNIWQKVNLGKIHTFSLTLAFIMMWNAINISFFTWLLTGGVIIFIIITAFKNKIVKLV